LEEAALRLLEEALPGCRIEPNVFYTPDDGDRTECDGLVMFDRFLILVEAKGASLSPQALRGDTARLIADVEVAIGSAWDQVDRAHRYVRSADEVTFEDEQGLERLKLRSSDFDTILAVNPTLHPFPMVAGSFAGLAALGLDRGSAPPWSVFINDLRIAQETFRGPVETLGYMLWRSELVANPGLTVEDEVDLLGTFLLRDRVHDLLRRPNARAIVMGSSNDFDQYYSWELGDGPRHERPRMFQKPLSRAFLTRMNQQRPEGWVRASIASLFLNLRELAFVCVEVPRTVPQLGRGQVVSGAIEECTLTCFGEGLDLSELLEEPVDTRFAVYAGAGGTGPRIVWATDGGPDAYGDRAGG
jgi:hypothetical protein